MAASHHGGSLGGGRMRLDAESLRDYWKKERRPGAPTDLQTLRRIVTSFHPYRWQVAFVLFAILISTLLGLVAPLATKRIFDDAFAHRDLSRLIWYVAAMFAAPVLANLIGFGQTIVNTRVGQNLMRDYRNRLYAHLQRMPLRFYTGTRAGEIQSRITNDVGSVQSVLTGTAPQIVSNLATVVSAVIAMCWISPTLTLISLGLLPLFLFITYRVGRIRRTLWRERQKAMASFSAHIYETLSVSGILLIKTFGRQDRVRSQFDEQNRQLMDLEMRQQVIGRWSGLAFGTIFAAIPALTYLIAGWQMIKGGSLLGGTMTAGTLIAFTALQGRFFGPASQLLGLQSDIMSALALFDRIFEYLDLPIEIVDRPGAIRLRPSLLRGEIEFRDVTFVYKRGAHDLLNPIGEEAKDRRGDGLSAPKQFAPAVRGVSFQVRPGQIVALVGPSGAGKSTLAQLVPRLYDPSGGAVLIDGIDLRDLALDALAEVVGVVTQETFLLHASIRENILYGRPDATEAQMVAAAKAAAIHDRILESDQGYETVVGERGYRLSGGEKQRIAIARVILKDPRIIILDEATSALDIGSERLVQEAMDRLMVGRTSLVIAHRLSTIVSADLILVLEKGEIVERGTHAELLSRGGRYERLYRMQFTNPRAKRKRGGEAEDERAGPFEPKMDLPGLDLMREDWI